MAVFRRLATAALGLAIVAGVHAADAQQNIRQALGKLQSDLVIEQIEPSPLEGLYQVQLKGGRVLYASADGRYLMQGYLFELPEQGSPRNLTEQLEAQGIAREINGLPAADMVVFKAVGERKTHITVFTDTDCGYCQNLHSEVPELNRRGIEVRYLAFPRQGPGSHGYNTLVNVWCAKNPQEAMNQAKARQEIPAASCAHPIDKQFLLGQSIGVNGTPAIVLASGQMIPGYQPAPQLAKLALQAR